MKRWSGVAIHHSHTRDGRTLSADDIRRFHIEDRGWKDAGYQYICERVEDHVEVIVGRPLHLKGAHAPPRNDSFVGLCYVGNFDKEPPDEELLRVGIRRVVVPMIVLFEMEFPGCVLPHREITPNRTCPGILFPWPRFMDMVAEEIEAG